MEFLLGMFLGYLIFSDKDDRRECGRVRAAVCTQPITKKPPSVEK